MGCGHLSTRQPCEITSICDLPRVTSYPLATVLKINFSSKKLKAFFVMPDLLQPRGNSLMSTLYESWTQCGGDWKKSTIYLNATSKDTNKRRGERRWMVWKEIVEKFGLQGATDLVEYKKSKPDLAENEIRKHPNAPDSKETRSNCTGLNHIYTLMNYVPHSCYLILLQWCLQKKQVNLTGVDPIPSPRHGHRSR